MPPPAPPADFRMGATMLQSQPDVRMGTYSFPSGAPVAPSPSMPQVPVASFSKSQYAAGPPIEPVLPVGAAHHVSAAHWPPASAATAPASLRDLNGVELSRLQQHPLGARVEQLPDAYQMYNFGQRQVYYSTNVNVPEPNLGVMINAEFPTEPRHINREIVVNDEAIRNRDWRYIGGMVRRVHQTHEEELKAELQMHAEYQHAVDLKGEHKLEYAGLKNQHLPDYHTLMQQRQDAFNGRLAQRVKQRLEREVLNEHQMLEFFKDPDAVAFHGA